MRNSYANLVRHSSHYGIEPSWRNLHLAIEINHEFVIERFSFKNFIIDHHNKQNEEVSDQEDIYFLTLWLSYYVYYSGSLQIAKKCIPLTIQLHEGRKISLAKMLLANLYQSLGNASYKLKHLPETNKSYPVSGSLWLLQLWLNAIFEPKLHITKSKALLEEIDCKSIKGTILSLVTYYDNHSQINFMKCINLFLESTTFVSTMAHFVDRCFGPTWFPNMSLGVTSEAAAMLNFVWADFLTPTLLSTRIKIGTFGFVYIGYQPNLVAR